MPLRPGSRSLDECNTRHLVAGFFEAHNPDALRVAPNPDAIERLTNFNDNWHKVETSWQAMHPLAAGAWMPWLKTCLKLLEN